MKIFTAILALCVIAFAAISPAVAQDTPEYFSALDTINRINKSKPQQRAGQDSVKEVIKGRILDSRNKVVGEIKDVILDRNGAISQLDVEFDRLRLGTDRMTINYSQFGVRPVSNGFKLSYTDDQIVELVPAILGGIETASGGNNENYSIRKMVGRTVKNKDGKTIGKVSDILFDNGRADYLLIAVSANSARGEKVAVPFSRPTYKGTTITLDDTYAKAVVDYAVDNK
jgi:sporulation protein YlmC with PRC-barrel domain